MLYLHVFGSLFPCHFIILGLFASIQCVPHLPQYLVNGGGLFKCTLFNDIRSLFFHKQHEGVKRFLDVLFLFLHLRSNHPRVRRDCRIWSHRLTECGQLRGKGERGKRGGRRERGVCKKKKQTTKDI